VDLSEIFRPAVFLLRKFLFEIVNQNITILFDV